MKIEQQYDKWLSEQHKRLEDNSRFKKNFVGERGYKHFDSVISLSNARKYKIRSEVCELEKLKKHKFWPFIRIDKMARRFTKNQKKEIIIKHKNRHLMYASHLDAIIMSFYAWILKDSYEHRIHDSLADESVIGYRKILGDSARNKSNIDFAFDIYQKVLQASNSVVLCIDIEDFFGSINHNLLIRKVHAFVPKNLFGAIDIVLKSVTKYRYIFRHDV